MFAATKAAIEERALNEYLCVDCIVQQSIEYIDGIRGAFHPLNVLWGNVRVSEIREITDFYGSPLIMKYFTDSVVLHIIGSAIGMRRHLTTQAGDRCYVNSHGNQHEAVKLLIAYYSKGKPPVTLARSRELNEIYLAWEDRSPQLRYVNSF
jgi:hypothetical protein